tara:strand:+ start:2416 stop:2634 length:219 start_codon:yes stop_codon:yes gene_type:complete
MTKQQSAKQLYNLLDGIVGTISERGWDFVDRYWKDFDKSLSANMMLLKALDKELGQKFEKECIQYGILEMND